MRRIALVPIAAVALVLATASPATAGGNVGATADEDRPVAQAQNAQAPQITYTYDVQTRGGVATDPDAFAATAASVLGDARSWTLGGSIAFEEVASGGDFNLVLASPGAVDAAHEVCSPSYSCRVGDDVLINDENWRNATSAWRERDDAPLWMYRQYLLGHEIGHWLGFGHVDCPAGGAQAPVMQQQSISLQGCQPSGWPRPGEREDLGGRLDVPVHDDWVFPDVLRGDTHRDAIHAAYEASVARGYEDGYYRQREPVTREQMATFLARALELDTEGGDPPPFEDVDPDGAHADAIAAVSEAEIAQGHEDGTFRPREPIDRAQMATFLTRAYDLEAEGAPEFDDVDPDSAHAEAIAAVSEAEIAEGYPDGTYRPSTPVDRAEMATFIVRADPDV